METIVIPFLLEAGVMVKCVTKCKALGPVSAHNVQSCFTFLIIASVSYFISFYTEWQFWGVRQPPNSEQWRHLVLC